MLVPRRCKLSRRSWRGAFGEMLELVGGRAGVPRGFRSRASVFAPLPAASRRSDWCSSSHLSTRGHQRCLRRWGRDFIRFCAGKGACACGKSTNKRSAALAGAATTKPLPYSVLFQRPALLNLAYSCWRYSQLLMWASSLEALQDIKYNGMLEVCSGGELKGSW